MHLKLLQPLLAIPLYTFVLRHAAAGSRELEMARRKLSEANAAATSLDGERLPGYHPTSLDGERLPGYHPTSLDGERLPGYHPTSLDAADRPAMLPPSASVAAAAAAMQRLAAEAMEITNTQVHSG